jgi:hypothetical protein
MQTIDQVRLSDSKLTRLLQNSLGGNSYTAVLATIHPVSAFAEECVVKCSVLSAVKLSVNIPLQSTLQFANRCRSVRNNPRVNYVGTDLDKDKRIKRLLEEVSSLKTRLAQNEQVFGAECFQLHVCMLPYRALRGLVRHR